MSVVNRQSTERGGVKSIVTDGVGTSVTTITFANPLPAAPTYVVATVSSPINDGAKLRVDQFSSTGFRAILTGAAASTSVPISWAAGIRLS